MDRVMAAMVFNHICDLGSLSAAARALGLSRPMVSRYLDEMEKWAGARLIHRSSRRLTITPAGEEALLKTRSLAQLSLDIGAASGAQIPSGTLRVACAHLPPCIFLLRFCRRLWSNIRNYVLRWRSIINR